MAQNAEVHKISVTQIGTDRRTTITVVSPPGTTYRDVVLALKLGSK